MVPEVECLEAELTTTFPDQDEERRGAILQEAQRIEDWAEVWNSAYRRDAVTWRRINTFLVVTSALLAAIAAGTGLASLTTKTVAGLIALGSAAFSGAASALGASSRASQSQTTSAADSSLADDARKFVKTDAPYLDLTDVVTEWEGLCKKRDAVVANAPVTRLLWRRAPQVTIPESGGTSQDTTPSRD